MKLSKLMFKMLKLSCCFEASCSNHAPFTSGWESWVEVIFLRLFLASFSGSWDSTTLTKAGSRPTCCSQSSLFFCSSSCTFSARSVFCSSSSFTCFVSSLVCSSSSFALSFVNSVGCSSSSFTLSFVSSVGCSSSSFTASFLSECCALQALL